MGLFSVVHKSVHTLARNDRGKRVQSLLLATLLSLGITGCGGSPNVGPTPGLSIAQATDLGTIPTIPDILGRDGGYSALFQGNSVWAYGDTFLANPNFEGRTLISDTWSFTTDLNAADGIAGFQERLDSSGAPAMLLQESATEQAFNQAHNGNPCQQQPCGQRWALWPSSIVVDPASNQAYVFYMVVLAAPGAFNFQGYGTSVATWQSFAGQPQRPSFNPPIVADHPDLMFGQTDPSFGTASLVDNGTMYIYGCKITDNGNDNGCRLGRVAPSSVADPTMWTFYAGNGNWSSQVQDAISVSTGSSIVSVSFNNYLQQFIAVYSAPFSNNVIVRTAPNPEGPWSKEITAFTAMAPASGNIYDAHAHSEYDANGGQTIFVSYSRSTGAFTSEVRLVSLQLLAGQMQ